MDNINPRYRFDIESAQEDSTPERRLCGAILERSLRDLNDEAREVKLSAVDWFKEYFNSTPSKKPHIFCFANLVEVFSLSEKHLSAIKDRVIATERQLNASWHT